MNCAGNMPTTSPITLNAAGRKFWHVNAMRKFCEHMVMKLKARTKESPTPSGQ